MSGPLRTTKLHAWHVGAGARMTDFGGWDMPVQYPTGPREEHLKVRSAAGLFDIDHMGRFALSGRGALDFMQAVQTWDASRVAKGRAHYSLLCSDAGGIIDDVFLYHFSAGTGAACIPDAEWLVVVNAANRAKDLAWLSDRITAFDVKLRDISDETCMIAVQGPTAFAVLQALTDLAVSALGYHRLTRCSVAGISSILCTTGYTGEPGFEIIVAAASAEKVWKALLEAGARHGLIPCGLAARDSLRAEACLPLYGHEIGEDTDPFSAGLGKAAVRMDGHEFIGKPALLPLSRMPPARKQVGFQMTEASVPRQGYPIAASGREIGRVTTGLFSPSTSRYIGMGYVKSAFSTVGQRVDIVIRGATKPARIVERPFYRSPHWGSGPRGS